jgi:flavodoxin
VWVYVVFSSRTNSTIRIARSIASSVEWSNEYEARHAMEVDPGEIHGPGVIFLGYPSGGSELDRAIRSFLDHIPERTMYSVLWAVFDTRCQVQPAVAGSAIRRLRRAIEHRGGRLLLPPESFFVGQDDGSVPHGELERARCWGASAIAAAVRTFHDTTVRAGFLSGGTRRPEWESCCAVPS